MRFASQPLSIMAGSDKCLTANIAHSTTASGLLTSRSGKAEESLSIQMATDTRAISYKISSKVMDTWSIRKHLSRRSRTIKELGRKDFDMVKV